MGCMQRIRRFLSNVGISPTITVLPLIRLMRPLLSNLPEIVLAMDRTNWEKRKDLHKHPDRGDMLQRARYPGILESIRSKGKQFL